jgi:hypothetical protein
VLSTTTAEEERTASTAASPAGNRDVCPVDPAADPEADPPADPEADPPADPEADPPADPEAEPPVDPEVDPSADPEVDPPVDPEAELAGPPVTGAGPDVAPLAWADPLLLTRLPQRRRKRRWRV